ncbi:phospholipase-like protein [Tanacetum coccineum]|uniref:Phospholipase-like protein n=1 Tax=Tanacetum coccineum TaxID=301880 RepID=A0ABQ5CNV6_9ASTR
MDNVIEVFDAKVTMRSTLHTLASIKELLSKSGNERRNTIFRSTQFGKWLDFPSFANDNHLLNYIFQHRVKQEQNNNDFPPITYKIGDNTFDFGQPLKRVRVIDLLVVTRSAHLWYGLSDEDAVKVCLLLVVNIVFMDREPKNYITDNLLELVDDLPTWDAYPWGEYIWKAFYRRTVNVISRHRAAIMTKNKKNASIKKKKKKSPTSKKNETYNVYGFVWALKKVKENYDERSIIGDVHKQQILVEERSVKPQFEAEVALERQSELDVPMFTREELVAEHHAIKERVQIIENLADADPSIILQQLAAVKERITAIETFLNYPKVRYHVLNGEFSCDINRPNEHMFEESIENELESGDGKDNAGFDLDSIENHSLNDMVRTGTEDIHLDE